MSHIFYSSEMNLIDVSQIGGKAKNLAILSKQGIPVPSWFALTVDFFQEFMGEDLKDIDLILCKNYKNIDEIITASKEIIKIIEARVFNENLKHKVLTHMEKTFGNCNKKLFSVRSSAVDEDSISYSFAGQLESYLFVERDVTLFTSVKKCFVSAYSERAMAYRFINSIPIIGVRPAVIIQEMIFGEVSGVMFTGNPLTNNVDETLINGTYGIGEGIVSGELDTDTWVVDESCKIIKKTIVSKTEELVFDSEKGYGTKKQFVNALLIDEASLSDDNVLQLFKLGMTIEEIFNSIPQDIEWCIANSKIYILQSRPITTLSHIRKNLERTILDNSNIIESFPGVTSPLTFSFASKLYELVYRRFYTIAGATEKQINSLDYRFRNMVSYVDGRIYYNLNSWYGTIQLVPGYNINRRLMENMMGVKVKIDIDKETEPSLIRKIFIEVPHLLRAIFKGLNNFLFIEKIIKKFIKNFDNHTQKYMDEKFVGYTNKDILDKLQILEKNIFAKWDAPIINDFLVMIFYGILTKLISALPIEDKSGLQNDLLCGQGDVESTKPTREIIKISNYIRNDKALFNLFINSSEERLIDIILNKNLPQYSKISVLIKTYISEFGFRCMNEMKLEENSIKEDPTFLFITIKNYLRKPPIDLEQMEEQEKKLRLQAEKIIFSELKGFKKLKFKWVLKHARKSIKNRERLRFMRTKIVGIYRSMLNAVGRNFTKDNLIDNYKDIFFLKENEIFELVEGRSVDREYTKTLIELRKKDFSKNLEKEPWERLHFYGDLYNEACVDILSEDEVLYSDTSSDINVLKGVPCSPGIIKGKAKIVLSPYDANLNGEILVAKRTDPGWVPLFPSVSGIIIERGSVLSHSAVVAREMGIPTIVGLRKVTEVIHNDDLLNMNGSTGVVEKIS